MLVDRGDWDPLMMLSRFLDAARDASGAETLAIADDMGLLIAGSGSWARCEELAAHAPLRPLAETPANDTVPTRLDVLARRSEVRRLTMDGMRVYVCGEGDNARQAVTSATDGVWQILRVARGGQPRTR